MPFFTTRLPGAILIMRDGPSVAIFELIAVATPRLNQVLGDARRPVIRRQDSGHYVLTNVKRRMRFRLFMVKNGQPGNERKEETS